MDTLRDTLRGSPVTYIRITLPCAAFPGVDVNACDLFKCKLCVPPEGEEGEMKVSYAALKS